MLVFDKSITDEQLIPNVGDFSFISDEKFKNSLTYDYNYFKSLDCEDAVSLIFKTKNNFFSAFWKTMRTFCYEGHTTESYHKNIMILDYIYNNGWTEFVISFFNGKFN